MAVRFNFNDLVSKLLHDAPFRRAVMKDPAKALKAYKVKPTRAQVAALRAVNWKDLEKVQNAFRAGVHPQSFT